MSLSISLLDKKDLLEGFDEVLFKITAITGIGLPNTDLLIKFLKEQIIDFLLEFGYEDLTIEEISLAFMINAENNLQTPSGIELQYIENFGKYINVYHFSKIVHNYMAIRNLLDRKIQNQIDGY